LPHEMVGFLSYPAGAAHAFVGVTVFPDMAGSLAASTVELTRSRRPQARRADHARHRRHFWNPTGVRCGGEVQVTASPVHKFEICLVRVSTRLPTGTGPQMSNCSRFQVPFDGIALTAGRSAAGRVARIAFQVDPEKLQGAEGRQA